MSSSNVLSYFVLGNASSSFSVGEEVFQGDKDNIILDTDNGTNSANIVSHFLTLVKCLPKVLPLLQALRFQLSGL